jgi:hypothetical protein
MDVLDTFEDLKPISLYHSIYKIIAKLTSRRIKPLLSKVVSSKQVGFLMEGRYMK